MVPEHDPAHKVTIIPRGRALGLTIFLPERDRYSATQLRLESEIAALLGGCVAEEIDYGDGNVTTAAQIDSEVRDIVDRNYQRARQLLTENRDLLERVARALVLHETLSSEQIDALMAGGDLATPADDIDQHHPPRGAQGNGVVSGQAIPVGRPAKQI